VVEVPPNVPHPSVNDGVRPLPTPMQASPAGEFTSSRLTGRAVAKRPTSSGLSECTAAV
jgi:hypothetical protein